MLVHNQKHKIRQRIILRLAVTAIEFLEHRQSKGFQRNLFFCACRLDLQELVSWNTPLPAMLMNFEKLPSYQVLALQELTLSLMSTGSIQLKMLNEDIRKLANFNSSESLVTQVIKQYGAFLSSSNNKLELIRFLASRWQANNSFIDNTQVNIEFDEFCIQLGSNNNAEDLSCNHEEADTRMLCHGKKISQSFKTW